MVLSRPSARTIISLCLAGPSSRTSRLVQLSYCGYTTISQLMSNQIFWYVPGPSLTFRFHIGVYEQATQLVRKGDTCLDVEGRGLPGARVVLAPCTADGTNSAAGATEGASNAYYAVPDQRFFAYDVSEDTLSFTLRPVYNVDLCLDGGINNGERLSVQSCTPNSPRFTRYLWQ